MSDLWKAELDELTELRQQHSKPVSHESKVIARDMERRAELPKIPRDDDGAFLKGLDKIIRGDLTVGDK